MRLGDIEALGYKPEYDGAGRVLRFKHATGRNGAVIEAPAGLPYDERVGYMLAQAERLFGAYRMRM